MLLDKKYAYHTNVQDELRAFEQDVFAQINLGKHFAESQEKYAFEII